MLFTPILKTKSSSEFSALNEVMGIVEKSQNIIPYIECIKSINNRCVQKYVNLLDDKVDYFFEPLESDIKTALLNINLYSSNCILVLRVTKTTSLTDIETFVLENKKNKRHYGLKINDADDRYLTIIKRLSNSDYLFIELGGTAYTSSFFLDDIKSENLDCKIVIHSNERAQYLRGEDFNDLDYNNSSNFNLTIIDAIKAGTFEFDGFGSRCTAKDDNTEEVRIAKEVYGVFLIYNYSNNSIYSIKSDNKDHISRIYKEVRDKVNANKLLLDSLFFNHTLVAKKTLENYLSFSKTSSSRFIAISIIRYIEEIANNLV